MLIQSEVIRGWLYAFAFVVFILLFAYKVVTGEVDFDTNLLLNLLGLGASGLATMNTSRNSDDV